MDNGRDRAREIVIAPGNSRGLFNLREICEFRELLYMLSWRDIKVRYKQTVIGIAWVVLKPLLAMSVFTIIFGRLAKFPSDGAPYPVFVMAGLIPWSFFSASVAGAAQSVVAGSSLVGKIYFPRLLIPLGSSAAHAVDFLVSLILLAVLTIYYSFFPAPKALFLPLVFLFLFIAAAGPGLLFSALYVRYRDMGHIVPFLLQVWMYATPVVYPASFIPEKFRWILYINPMAGVIEFFRWLIIPEKTLDLSLAGISLAASVLLFIAGYSYFRKTERTFADEI